jgi:hypothetical protein
MRADRSVIVSRLELVDRHAFSSRWPVVRARNEMAYGRVGVSVYGRTGVGERAKRCSSEAAAHESRAKP